MRYQPARVSSASRLLALGAALGPLGALLDLPRVLAFDGCFFDPGAGALTAAVRRRLDAARGRCGIERLLQVDRARELDDGGAVLGGLVVEQPLGAVEPAGGDAGLTSRRSPSRPREARWALIGRCERRRNATG